MVRIGGDRGKQEIRVDDRHSLFLGPFPASAALRLQAELLHHPLDLLAVEFERDCHSSGTEEGCSRKIASSPKGEGFPPSPWGTQKTHLEPGVNRAYQKCAGGALEINHPGASPAVGYFLCIYL